MITRLREHFPVAYLCQRLEVSRSAYYEWMSGSAARQARTELVLQIDDAFTSTGCMDGYRKVTATLARRGIVRDRKTIARYMRVHGMVGFIAQRQFQRAKQRQARPADPPDLVGREFTSDEPGEILVSDITYIPTGQGWLYMATVIDVATRMVLGYACARTQTAKLVIQALSRARATGIVAPDAIFHSDHGIQYRSRAFARACGHRIRRSMGAHYQCWDNAVAESFFSKLKSEHLDRVTFLNRQDAAAAVDEYVARYNNERLHESLDYHTPAEHLEQLQHVA
ncbi:IS3 family transposase [Microbacterium horticulturae]|uniref:IS3 family transposase n=1 Tax=Microbacterium horticulturae TaxID=3028316 RepID=A0ABY8BX06_9MICO|nr:IS3 family transposase [Microbacterium sp. KACC 23027]WEG08726.1 IS3 family transposase [Microbacterium sp. KACC 23027]